MCSLRSCKLEQTRLSIIATHYFIVELSFIQRLKCRDDWPVIRADAPVRNQGDVGFFLHPFARHAGTQQDVINAAVAILDAVIICPRDVRRFATADGVGQIVAVALGGARVHEFGFATSDEGFGRGGIFGVVEVAEDDKIRLWFGGEDRINSRAQNSGLF